MGPTSVTPHVHQIMLALRQATVVPVIRTSTTELATRAVAWLQRADFTTFEITLTVPGALELIRDLRSEPRFTVGAGTVLDAAEADACIDAGAQFIVTPVLATPLIPVCADADVPAILSGLTPTEVWTAYAAGAAAVKVFPAGSMGGPSHVRALRSVFPDVPLIPTGGVHLENLLAYLSAGAACVGIGSDLISDERIADADPEAWIERARAYARVGAQHAPLRHSSPATTVAP